MRLEVKAENLGDDDLALQIESFTRRLCEYPVLDVLTVLQRWPDENRFWPAWHELKAAMDERVAASQARDIPRLPGPVEHATQERERRWQRMTHEQRRAEIQCALDSITPNNPMGAVLKKIGKTMLERIR